MHGDSRPPQTTHPPARQLALNLLATLRVAGPQRSDGSPGLLRDAAVQRSTGIARSTLRALKATSREANPDLRTLCRLADALQIPVAFLLMRPQDWEVLCAAINALRTPLAAAERLTNETSAADVELAERVLKECGVHPERPPLGGHRDDVEMARLHARNEWRRRTSLVFAALTQSAARENTNVRVLLTALVASYVNEATPRDPASS